MVTMKREDFALTTGAGTLFFQRLIQIDGEKNYIVQ